MMTKGLVWVHQVDLERKVEREEAETWCRENGDLPYIETSAKDATNVEASFMMCLKRWANIEGRQVRFLLVICSLHKVWLPVWTK